jgi:hypothetical protein
VGERRAELFVPSVSGRVLPRVPDSPADLEAIDPDIFKGSRRGGPRVVQVVLDRKVLAEAVLDEYDDAGARQ